MTERREDAHTRTTRSLHGLAELVLAGPRYRQGGSIELRVQDGGFRTRDEPAVAVNGTSLVTPERRVDLDGLTFAQAAARIGLEASRLDDVYSDGPGVEPDEPIRLDPDAARLVEQALALGDQALRSFHPAATPILWPEHFDVATVAGEVNYGVSPGDRYLDEPYAYIGPWTPREGAFWNAPFGAARPMRDRPDADALVAFFTEGRTRA